MLCSGAGFGAGLCWFLQQGRHVNDKIKNKNKIWMILIAYKCIQSIQNILLKPL